MAYYYHQAGTVLPPQQMVPVMNEKPGIYGAYNGGAPVTMATRPPISTGVQYIHAPALMPGSISGPGQITQVPMNAVISQQRPSGPPAAPATPQAPSVMGLPTAAPYPISSAPQVVHQPDFGGGGGMQQNPYMATAGLYQGVSLAYPQPNISTSIPSVSASPYANMGRSVSPYAAPPQQHIISKMPNSTYPAVGGMPVGFQAVSASGPPHDQAVHQPQNQGPRYTISTDGLLPTPPHPQAIRARLPHHQLAATAGGTPPAPGVAGYHPAAHPQPVAGPAHHPPQQTHQQAPMAGPLHTFPHGLATVIGGASLPGNAGIPTMSPAMGAPLVANPNYQGASPYHQVRGLP